MPKQRLISTALMGAAITLTPYRVAAQKSASPDYFPARVGDTWTMRVHTSRQDVEGTIVVANVEKRQSDTLVTRETRVNNQLAALDLYRITPQGIWMYGGKERTHFEPGLPILKFPVKSGSKWTYEGTMFTPQAQNPIKASLDTTGPFTLKTPAGTLQTVKVRVSIVATVKGGEKMNLILYFWFAPGVGIVQTQVGTVQPQAGELANVIMTVQHYKLLH